MASGCPRCASRARSSHSGGGRQSSSVKATTGAWVSRQAALRLRPGGAVPGARATDRRTPACGERVGLEQLGRLGPARIVPHDDLEPIARQCLLGKRVEQPAQAKRPIVRGNDDRDLGQRIHGRNLERLGSDRVTGEHVAGKTVLVTGAQGFVGSWLAERLLDAGARVVAWRRSTGSTRVSGSAPIPRRSCRPRLRPPAPVAQWIERSPPEREAGGSNPPGRVADRRHLRHPPAARRAAAAGRVRRAAARPPT